ncbi:titin-like [Ostrinia nubilalis]|uniref:titin-like n=1 Tax=Ostrinia nubilalis TaxID=29057 RepID=UPI0030822510
MVFQAQIIDSELTAKLLGRGVAVSPVVTVEPRRRKFHKAITLSMPAPRPHTQGMTNQYSTSSAPTLRLLCSISGGTNRAHWEDVTENTPLTFVNDCVSFTTTVSARYWLIDCRHIEDATKMATELYREAIHVPFMARFVVYAKRTDDCQAQLRMFCVTDDKEDKALERIERFIQVAKSRDVEVHEGKPIYLEFGGNLVPVAKSGEQLSIPFRAFRENRVAFPVMIKTQDLEPICRCQFMRDPKVPKGEPSPAPIAVLNIMVPDDTSVERTSPQPTDTVPLRTEEQELIWRQRLSDPRLEDICNLLGKDWVALAYELGVSVATVNQIQAKRITAAEQAQLMLKLWKTQSGTKAQDTSLELALCRIGRDDIIAPQSEVTNERRIQRNIYQERQASEEIEAYKAEEDNKLKDKIYDENQIAERLHRESEQDHEDEAKYSPEEKSIVDKSESLVDRTPTPSEESEEDEDVKRSVAERKEQITRKLSSSKIPASKQKKEIREEIIEIKTQIKPDIKKFHDIEQQVQVKEKDPKLERTRSKTSPETLEETEEIEIHREEIVEVKKEEPKPVERPVEQFRKFDPSSPAKPTPKHLQRHMRNESMRFPSGDFSNVTITPRKSVTETTEVKQVIEKVDTFTKEVISQKEIVSSKVEEKLDDGEKSPELVTEDDKDIAEATLRDKISSFESKIPKEPSIDLPKTTVKLTKEALKKHTLAQEQGNEYTQEFVREQSKQISSMETQEHMVHKVSVETERQVETVKSVKETIQHFDSKIKYEDKGKPYSKTIRTDSTLVQVSSEEDSEFLKKSTDSETETESQTTVKVDKLEQKIKSKIDKESFAFKGLKDGFELKSKDPKTIPEQDDKKSDDDDKKDDHHVAIKLEKQMTEELRSKVSEEEITEAVEEKEVSVSDKLKDKIEPQLSIASTKSDLSKHTKTDSISSDVQDLIGRKISQESPVPSGIEKTDSLADLQQSTEKDFSFISQTESKVYSKDSKHRSDSLDEASQFSDLEDQIGTSPAHRPVDKDVSHVVSKTEVKTITVVSDKTTHARDQTLEFLRYESEYSAQIHAPTIDAKDAEKVSPKESPVISAKARQFIETVPEDDSVQECFFSKRIYSDSLEDSEHTDSRRHSEAESLKSDQSDVKAKVSSSDFDERAEYEETVDSGSGFGDEKFEESVGFTSMRIDTKTTDSEKQDSESDKEPEVVFKKMGPKRHSRTESVSISKISDLQLDLEPAKPKQEFQMFVTEAEEVDKSDKDEPSDKISSESSREIEISERKSSEGISDKISSEDAVTEKKTSSEEDALKDGEVIPLDEKVIVTSVKEITKEIVKTDVKTFREDTIEKVDAIKRQSVTSAGSGSVSELRLEEKRLSDAHSLTESRDYTFEESEDDIGTQGTHVDMSKDKVETKLESEKKAALAKVSESKLARLTHGDSLDDVEGFPEDHVTDYVHKLPHIAEVGAIQDRDITNEFLNREREEQLKRETIHIVTSASIESTPLTKDEKVTETHGPTVVTKVTSISGPTEEISKVVDQPKSDKKEIVDSAYTVTETHEPTVITTTTTITKEGEEPIQKVLKSVTSEGPTSIDTRQDMEITYTVTEHHEPTIVTKFTAITKEVSEPTEEIFKTVKLGGHKSIDTRQVTETSYTVTEHHEPTIVTKVTTISKDFTGPIEEVFKTVTMKEPAITDSTQEAESSSFIITETSEPIVTTITKDVSDPNEEIFKKVTMKSQASNETYIETHEPTIVTKVTTITKDITGPIEEVLKTMEGPITTDTAQESESIVTVVKQHEPTVVTKVTTVTKDITGSTGTETTTTETIVKETSSKFDVSKIRTDTLGKFDLDEDFEEVKRFVPKSLDLKEVPEITKEQVKPVIDDILQKGTIAAAARSPILDKDIKIATKDIVESEKRSYDAKVPHKEERRHSCISPAISLERIAESEVETEDEQPIPKPISLPIESHKVTETSTEMKKSDSAMKQMADNIEIIIKQASEDFDVSSDEQIEPEEPSEQRDIAERVSVDSIIEEAVTTVEEMLESSKEAKEKEIEAKKEIVFEETKKFVKERPGLIKSLSRDSGEIVIMPKKKHPRTFSVQSSPEEVEEQIYTDSESDMDKAKVLEIIEPTSDLDGKIATSSFDTKKLRTDSLDDADDFPEKESEYFGDDVKFSDEPAEGKFLDDFKPVDRPGPSHLGQQDTEEDRSSDKMIKKTHFVDRILHSDLVSKSTTESSVTTVVSTLTKSSDESQKSVLEDGTSAEFSKISGAELVKDPSKTSFETKDDSKIEEPIEDRGTPDLSKKSIDLTKDYSKSSIDSKDTSRDFATNELSKDSTVDLSKDFSKASVESVKETSKSLDEKTFSEDHSSLDVSKTLASDASEGITISREFHEDEKSVSRVVRISTSSSQETSVMTESKLLSEQDDRSLDKTRPAEIDQEKDFIGEIDERIEELKSEMKKSEDSFGESSLLDKASDSKSDSVITDDLVKDDKEESKEDVEKKEMDDQVPDMTELNRRCSNLLEDISQGALIRIDSSHVTHDLASKFSKTPPPSPVDLKDRSKVEDGSGDRQTGLQLRGSDSSFLDASRQSPRASSAGDSLISETEAHQSDVLTEASKALTEAARPKSPSKHLADNLSFINVDQPTLTSGAIELVDRTIEKSIDVIDQIKKEQLAVKMEEMQKSTSSDTFYSESRVETSTSSSSVHKTYEGAEMKFQSIDPRAHMSDMVAKFGSTDMDDYSTILSHKETETRKISGQEYFSETKQVSSSDDDSLVIKTETTHELRGQEHEVKEKTTVRKEGDQTETSQKKLERAHEATAKRSDVETKTVYKTTDDTDIVKVEREFSEQGLYTGRQTKSEERMTALKDDTIKKKHEVKISERDMSHEQWGKEYFTEPGELEDIKEDDDSKARIAYVESALKIVEKDEIISGVEVSAKGKVISSKVEHHREESVIESKEHDDLSSDASHAPSFKSETAERRGSSETSPKSKSKSFKKDDEVYEVDFIKEIKVSTSPVKSTFSRTGSQDTHSESEVAPDLPHDDKTGDTPKKEKPTRSPVKLPQQQIQEQVWEVSLQKADSFEMADEIPKSLNLKTAMVQSSSTETKSSGSDTGLELQTVVEPKSDFTSKMVKSDMSPSTFEISDDISTTSKDLMIKSGESLDTECMIKSLESHEAEILQKSMDSTVSAETLHPSEFSTEADSAFLTGTDHKREEIKLFKEKSLEDICSSGYDTDLSSAEFHATKLESERVDLDSLMSAQPLADLSVLEKTIDEVKQSLEAAQVEIISEKSDGSSKYKQSPSEFQFKLLISPERPEVITEEPHHATEDHSDKTSSVKKDDFQLDSQTSISSSHKVSSQEETTTSDEEKGTVYIKESSPPLDGADISIRSDSGPHSILETESDIILSDREGSSKGSPEVKLRVQKHIKSKLGVVERRSASEVEGWSSSGESHYHSFEHSESRPLSSDLEVMMTAQSATEFDTALTSHDVSSQSLRTSKDYYTAASSLASRDSMKSLDSDGSSHVASIDISDASETLVPSANELKEELMESSTYVEQFLHEGEKEQSAKVKDVSDEEASGDEEDVKADLEEPVGKMKRSHEMRFLPKDMIPEHFPLESTSESIEVDEDSSKERDGSDTTISSQLRTDEILSSSISKLDMPSSQSEIEKKVVIEEVIKPTTHEVHAIPFSVTKLEKPTREFVDVESEIIPVGSEEYEEIVKYGSITPELRKSDKEEVAIVKTTVHDAEIVPSKVDTTYLEPIEIKEECVKKVVKEVSVIPFPVTEIPPSQREFTDIEDDIIPIGSKQYEEILKSKSDSAVPKTKAEKAIVKTPDSQLESKQSSTSSLKTHEHLSTPHTPLSAPSQSSLSTDNGREYVLDDMYDISETPELRSDLVTESSRSELVVTTEEKALHTYEKEQESPTSDEFEMVDKPSEMDDFVVIEEVAKEAQETDTEGKSVQIKAQKYEKKHDTEVEEYLSKASKKQESTSSAGSGSLSDEELLAYEIEQKRLQAQELAEIEAGKRWIQMQFEGDPRYDYERIPLEDIKEEEMTDFDASRIGSLSSQKESIGSYGSFRNSYGSLSESEMASRIRFRVRGDNDDISISSLQEFENLEKALMEQYQQHSSSSQESLNGSLPRRYILSKSQGDDISISSLKEFEGLESACLEALKAEILAKQKEALLLADPKEVSGSFLEREKRSYSGSSESSPPQKGGSPGQKSGSPSQKGGSPSQKVGSYGSPSQKLLTESAAIRKLIDQQMALEQKLQEQITPKVVTVKKFDERGAFFVAEPEPETEKEPKQTEVTEECTKSSSFVCAAAPSDGSAESIPGDCEEMMKILDQEEKSKSSQAVTRTFTDSGVIEVVRTTTVIQQKFVDGKKVSETVTSTDGEGAMDIPARPKQFDESAPLSFGSEMSSSIISQSSEMDSLMTVLERHSSEGEVVTVTKQTIMMTSDKPEDLEFSREGSMVRELSPSSGRSIAHSVISFSGKQFTDPASGSWSGQDEELSSSGSFSRGARADLMLGSTDSLEATSSNATRATYNYEVDTPMTGSLTSGGSNTMVSSLDTLDPVTAVQMESLEHQSTSEHYSHDYEVQEPDSDTERLELDGRAPRAKERTIMFDSTDTLSAVSGDNSVKEAAVETPAPTFYIGDTPIVRGDRRDEDDEPQPVLSGSCPASLPPATQPSPPVPAQRRSLTMIAKSPPSSIDETTKK